ncbi:protein of unknown function [Lactiplantibacillus plantarum]
MFSFTSSILTTHFKKSTFLLIGTVQFYKLKQKNKAHPLGH